jgi:hypothetical protein
LPAGDLIPRLSREERYKKAVAAYLEP